MCASVGASAQQQLVVEQHTCVCGHCYACFCHVFQHTQGTLTALKDRTKGQNTNLTQEKKGQHTKFHPEKGLTLPVLV
jgi:hypothetical protein